MDQYHGCRCPGSLRRQDISSHDIDYRISRSFSYLRKDFKYLCQINVEEWHKMEIHVYVPSEKFSMTLSLPSELNLPFIFSAGWGGGRCSLGPSRRQAHQAVYRPSQLPGRALRGALQARALPLLNSRSRHNNQNEIYSFLFENFSGVSAITKLLFRLFLFHLYDIKGKVWYLWCQFYTKTLIW